MSGLSSSGEALDVPVAMILFNRPEPTMRVFERIRAVRPNRLYIIADGPRAEREGEKEKCLETRNVVGEGVDWDCDLRWNIAEENLGCGRRVSSGIDWVFSQEERAIILEDDCVPDLTFFPYMAELLERFSENNEVMHISGTGWLPRWYWLASSYFFSGFAMVWGWATWRRAWAKFDYDMASWPANRNSDDLVSYLQTEIGKNWRRNTWNDVYEKRVDAWGPKWAYAVAQSRGLCVAPKVNLIENIGFDADGTHIQSKDHPFYGLKARSMPLPLRHCRSQRRLRGADAFLERRLCSMRIKDRVRRRLKSLVR